MIGLENPEVNEKIICIELKGHYGRLSFLKSSSYVVEICLASKYWMEYVVDELLNYNKLGQLAGDKFGNYVVEKALEHSKVTI